MTQHVRGDALARERRSISGGDGRNVLVEDVGNAVARQWLAVAIDEDEDVLLVGVHCRAVQLVQGVGGLAPQRQQALLSALTVKPHLPR